LPAGRFLVEVPATAKARYDSVFVPLSMIYGVSLPVLAAAFLNSLGAAFQNIRKHWPAMIVVPIFILAPVLMIFDESHMALRWQAQIATGDAWPYVIIFVLFPFCLLAITASLPRRDAR
jgi:protein-S-isoprenylcysteine O-methyltransferase Ste14